MANPADEIRKMLKSEKLVLGTENTIKNLKLGKLKKVYVSANCPERVRKDVSHYGNLAKAKIIDLNQQNDELGVLCRKPFSISLLGLKQ